MRGALARLTAAALSILLVAALSACADSAVAPHGEDNVTPPPGSTENVTIFAEGEDVALNGRLFGDSSRPLVILTHMRPNDQTAWYPFAEQLAADGYAAFAFDFRGHGMSTGEQDYDKLDEDLTAVINYWHDRGKESVMLVGASMGATTALVVAPGADVDAIVAISPPAQFEGQDALAAAPSIDVPMLFVVSELDAPTLQFAELYAAATEPKEEATYGGNLHGTALLDPIENEGASTVRARIIEFLDEQR
jgi:pimeloyl-ACP methyl ester carboxylesterase